MIWRLIQSLAQLADNQINGLEKLIKEPKYKKYI